MVSITSPADNFLTNQSDISVTGTVNEPDSEILVNGIAATVTGGNFNATVPLAEGLNTLTAAATDPSGNVGTASVQGVRDSIAPAISITSPSAGFLTGQAGVTVTGSVDDDTATVSVNGIPATVTGNVFSASISLAEGPNTILAQAVDVAGNTSEDQITGTVDTVAPEIVITDPGNLEIFNHMNLTVTGTVDDPTATVLVNNVEAAVSNGVFTAPVNLGQGTRFITAQATDPLGHVGTDNISVTVDLTPPRVILNTPSDGSTVYSSSVTVTGMINDVVSGTVNANNASVTVNGIQAVVSNRGFIAMNVPLAPGMNTIMAIGTDSAGNEAQVSSTVTLDTTAQSKIVMESGDNQTGVIGTTLPQPFVIRLVDAQGGPVAGHPVSFKVNRNNGMIEGGQPSVLINTDAQGLAQVFLTLGTRSGAGENRVEVMAAGFAGPVLFTATGTNGPALMIHQANESVFRGAVNDALPETLQVFVSDSGGNPVPGAQVTFTVVAGDGLVNNLSEVNLTTDSDGKAHVAWVLGPKEGIANNRVEANFAGHAGLPVTFVASALVPGPPENTSFSGVVLTNTDQPVPGVTVEIAGTAAETLTDEQGQFHLTGIPVGAVHLVIDPITTTLPGDWPMLMFEANAISGRDNNIGAPIFLLPLDTPNAKLVTETQGALIGVSNVQGFSLTVPPGGVNFPDGSQSGFVSVTQVHRDKVPMPPPNGLNPKIVFTVQPAGSIFEPPAPVIYPNIEGRPPGTIINLYSFDHDLGQWVVIGTGTVSDDGAFIYSDQGVGILKGGWHFPEPDEEEETEIEGTTNCDIPMLYWNSDVDTNISEWLEKTKTFLKNLDNPSFKLMLEAADSLHVEYTATDLKQFCGNTSLIKTTNGCFEGQPEGSKITIRVRENNAKAIITFVHELFHAWVYNSKLNNAPNVDGDEIPDNIEEIIGTKTDGTEYNYDDTYEDNLGQEFEGEAHKFSSKYTPKCN